MVIPGKTFIIGEYAVLRSSPAILLTTSPCFSMEMSASLSDHPTLHGIHEASPAGRFWRSHGFLNELTFQDPYQGLGGLGASSAQFIGAYRYACELNATPFSLEGLLAAYQAVAWDGVGVKPSGYDILAQTASQCVYVKDTSTTPVSFKWPFAALTFILVHTQFKCKTHEHLQALTQFPEDLTDLQQGVQQAWQACLTQDEAMWIDAIKGYAAALQAYGWVLDATRELQGELYTYPGVRAVKGCGALGADVVFVVVDRGALADCLTRMHAAGLHVLATEASVFDKVVSTRIPPLPR
ncbi:MAG: hypothetical protein NTW08_05200 [Gammaproteobacteria bacterium]|nr:hypothetical protein [Gammaproteobacteria bacterium]